MSPEEAREQGVSNIRFVPENGGTALPPQQKASKKRSFDFLGGRDWVASFNLPELRECSRQPPQIWV